jgi:hypothetical protein
MGLPKTMQQGAHTYEKSAKDCKQLEWRVWNDTATVYATYHRQDDASLQMVFVWYVLLQGLPEKASKDFGALKDYLIHEKKYGDPDAAFRVVT